MDKLAPDVLSLQVSVVMLQVWYVSVIMNTNKQAGLVSHIKRSVYSTFASYIDNLFVK